MTAQAETRVNTGKTHQTERSGNCPTRRPRPCLAVSVVLTSVVSAFTPSPIRWPRGSACWRCGALAPSRDEIDQRVAQVAAGRFRRPVLVLGIDGAYVPSRPERARGRRPGQARYRARRAPWRHAWYEAKGFRFYLLDGDRIVHLLSWHQVQSEEDLGKALNTDQRCGLDSGGDGATLRRR